MGSPCSMQEGGGIMDTECTTCEELCRPESKKVGPADRAMVELCEQVERRIGQDMHDALGAQLMGISVLAEVWRRKLSERSLSEANDAAELGFLAREALSRTRRLAHGLTACEVTGKSLPSALWELADRTREFYGVDCQCGVRIDGFRARPETAKHLHYIAQEAVSNAVRHGRPGSIHIHLTVNDSRGELVVSDNGLGLPDDLAKRRHGGLKIMRCRAAMIGGTLALEPNEPAGTTVKCEFNAES